MTSIVIAAFFGPLAAFMAFMIAYREYEHHFPDRARVLRESWHVAIVTLLVFLGLGVGLAIVLPWVLKQ